MDNEPFGARAVNRNSEKNITLTRILWDIFGNSALAVAMIWIFAFTSQGPAIGKITIYTALALTAAVIFIVSCGVLLGIRQRKGKR